MDKQRLLIADDEEAILELLKRGLSKDYEIITASTGGECLEKFDNEVFDASLIDVVLPDMDGLEILTRIKKTQPELPVIIMTGHATIEMAVKAMKLGAYYFVKKPFSFEEITGILERAIENLKVTRKYKNLKKMTEESFRFSGIIGKNKKMREIFEILELVASTDVSVLIEGESGTGKELVAKAIHLNSKRKDQNFIPINCSALPETLLESELFGYRKGAFTGAVGSKKGLFEAADGGTLFLDEIGGTAPAFQSKLLRVLEDGYFLPLGSTNPIKVDVRIISATNKIIEEEVNKKSFREDLYYRLNVVKIKLPPLRERKDDIPLLIQHFLETYNRKHNKNVERISEEAMDILLNYPWPGNIRELENVIERAVILSGGKEILPNLLPDKILNPQTPEVMPELIEYKSAKEIFERVYLTKLLKYTKGNVTEAAKIAGMVRQNLYLKFKQYNIDPRKFY